MAEEQTNKIVVNKWDLLQEKFHALTVNKNSLKYVSLVTLTLQNAILALSMRHARTQPGDLFISSTAVVMAELVKLFTCLILVFYEEGKNVQKFGEALHSAIIKNRLDTFKMCVPSLCYTIQNNLLYVSASHLDAATYQVTYQLKILTTAVFAVIILRKRLFLTQWGALLTLVAGVVLVQLAGLSKKSSSGTTDGHEQNPLIGFSAALGACVLSGFAGVYFEKMLKGADVSVWMRNIQLSLLSLPFGIITCLGYDFEKIHDKGFFVGYGAFVWYLVVLQAMGGLIVALVVKYADNILKGFATSLAIIISCIASIYLFNFILTIQFACGACLVIGSIFLYGFDPTKKKKQQEADAAAATAIAQQPDEPQNNDSFLPKV